MVKNQPANARHVRDMSSIPGSGRSPAGGHGNLLQYSCLENPMDRGVWWATVQGITQSWTRLKQLSMHTHVYIWFPGWLSGKEPSCQCKRCKGCKSNPWVRKIPWRMKWQPTPLFLSGEAHGQRSLVSYSLWGCKRVERDLTNKCQQYIYT